MPVPQSSMPPYRTKLLMARGENYFTMVHCPACKLEFRLLWPATLLSYPRNVVLHFKCPGCQASFNSEQLAPGKLCHIACGCEGYPAAPVESIEPQMKAKERAAHILLSQELDARKPPHHPGSNDRFLHKLF
jgi:hypothetical protein